MPGKLFRGWRAGWRLKRGAALYVASLFTEPDEGDVAWLGGVGTSGDVDRARWELRYARRALGLLVAERDSLDDRTSSTVAHQLAEATQSDRNVAADMVRLAERQLNERLRTYREVLRTRGAAESTSVRLGRALLRVTNPSSMMTDDAVARAGAILGTYVHLANEMLRKSFGEAALPDDQPPSALISGR